MLAVFVEGEHLDGNVARGGILLQVVEHGPAEHVGQKHVQRNGGGVKLAGQRQSLSATGGDEDLESLVVGQVAQDAGVVRIVFDDQQDCGSSGCRDFAIVGNLLDGAFRHADGRELKRGG